MNNPRDPLKQGYVLGITCYLLWGLLPIYFKSLPDIMPTEIVAQRIVWSMVFVLVVVALRREFAGLIPPFRNPRAVGALMVTAALIATNWLIYVWAVANGHILAASLGYFLNPLLTVMLGVVVLKEKLRPAQILAILLAAAGVVNLAFAALDTMWLSLMLAFSFGVYSLVRKVAPVGPLPGLVIETLMLLPFAVAYLLFLGAQDRLGFGQHWESTVLLMMAGVVSSVPLLIFAKAAQLMPLATMGVLQYIAPTIQFLLGLWLYREPLGTGKLASFVLIWIGLAVFTHDALRAYRAQAVRDGRLSS